MANFLEPVVDALTASFLFRCLLNIIIVAIFASAGTSASVSGLAAASRTSARLVGSLSRWWAHKGKVDREGLVEQLGTVCSFDSSLCLVQCGELDQNVALLLHQYPVLLFLHKAIFQETHLDVTSSAIQVHVQVLDLAVVAKQLLKVLLTGLFVDIGGYDNPAFN